MVYKKTFFYCIAFLAGTSLTIAEDRSWEETANLQAKATLERMTKTDFARYYKTHQSRKPRRTRGGFSPSSDTIKTHSEQPSTSGSSSLPTTMIFPGEFEEVKAVLITWPYIFFDSTRKNMMDFEYYGGRPLDDGIPVAIGQALGLPVFTTHVEYEGGNIPLDGSGNLFCSDVVYKTNAPAF